MNLEELNRIDYEAGRFSQASEKLERAQAKLGGARNGTCDLPSIIVEMSKSWRHDAEESAKDALFQVLNECKADLLRLAELRLAAQAREQKIKAAQKRELIHASIVDVRSES